MLLLLSCRELYYKTLSLSQQSFISQRALQYVSCLTTSVSCHEWVALARASGLSICSHKTKYFLVRGSRYLWRISFLLRLRTNNCLLTGCQSSYLANRERSFGYNTWFLFVVLFLKRTIGSDVLIASVWILQVKRTVRCVPANCVLLRTGFRGRGRYSM